VLKDTANLASLRRSTAKFMETTKLRPAPPNLSTPRSSHHSGQSKLRNTVNHPLALLPSLTFEYSFTSGYWTLLIYRLRSLREWSAYSITYTTTLLGCDYLLLILEKISSKLSPAANSGALLIHRCNQWLTERPCKPFEIQVQQIRIRILALKMNYGFEAPSRYFIHW
jgi:hypothetical protein